MTILTRVTRLFKADIHGVMDQIEDKELLIKQYLREMENSLQNKEIQLQQIAKTMSSNASRQITHQQEIEKIEKDLVLALKKEKDDIARLLIRKQRTQQMHNKQLQKQHNELEKRMEQLATKLEEQKLQYETLKSKAAACCYKSRNDMYSSAEALIRNSESGFSIGEDEIELELIRRKEALEKEGDTA